MTEVASADQGLEVAILRFRVACQHMAERAAWRTQDDYEGNPYANAIYKVLAEYGVAVPPDHAHVT